MTRFIARLALASIAFFITGPGFAAEIVKVAPAALANHLKTHDKVVVYFTSPDPNCGYCSGNADQGIAQVAAKLDSDISFVRVEWTPWKQWPPEVRSLGVTGIPATHAFKAGVDVYAVSGRVTDPTLFAAGLRTAFSRSVELAAITSVPPAALRRYVETHDKVVVYFTSPDKACSFCGGPADGLIARVAPLLDRDVSFIRVEWMPWNPLPPEVTSFGINGLPETRVFRGGVEVKAFPGRASDPARLAGDVRAALAQAPGAPSGAASAALPTDAPAAPAGAGR